MMVFALMALMTTAHVLMKVLACSLMLRLSAMWFWMYLCGDMALYFLYKLLRGDLRYWLNLEGALSWLTTLVIRVMGKIIVDFTLIVHFRHSFELGGAFWSFNVFSNQAFCFISVLLYGVYSDASKDVVEVLWKVVGGLFIFSMLNFGLFLKSIDKNYLWTFFDICTGEDYVVDRFREAENDAAKFVAFSIHPSFYKKINEDLMVWMNDNWSHWEETSPDWFTADAISNIPADMLPVTVLASMGGEAGRRKSIDAMKKEAKGNDESKRKQSIRGADLKIIPKVVGDEEGL